MSTTPSLTSKLIGLHPKLVKAVKDVLGEMARQGHPMIVTDGLRSTATQQALYAKGRTTPGPRVTNADGIKNKSNHQAKDDGLGYAVDCTFLHDGKPCWCEKHPWNVYGSVAKMNGLEWGGDWTSIKDRPHVELRGKK